MITVPAHQRFHMVLLLRWLLIIATSYLVLFNRPLSAMAPVTGLFIAAYLASNVLLPFVLPRLRSARLSDFVLVLFDIAAVSTGLLLTTNAVNDFFPVYFLVVFVAALTERLTLAVSAAVLISVVHLATLSRFVPANELLTNGYTLRVPFLFAVALFFGFVVGRARSRERVARVRGRQRRRAEVLSSITHDIKSPLANVQSMAELLLTNDTHRLSTTQADLVRRIHASVRHVIQLSVNLLDAARINAGRLAFQPSIMNLGDIVDDALTLARSAAAVKGVELRSAREPGLPLAVCDPLQVERVITNVLDNAIKYTPAGGTVTVITRAEHGQTVVEVRDTGPGIPSREIPALFEKFRRRREHNRIEGSGLGLFIVKAIIEAHGGSVDMQSTVGRGTTVRVTLPRVQREPSSETSGDAVTRPWRPFWAVWQ